MHPRPHSRDVAELSCNLWGPHKSCSPLTVTFVGEDSHNLCKTQQVRRILWVKSVSMKQNPNLPAPRPIPPGLCGGRGSLA